MLYYKNSRAVSTLSVADIHTYSSSKGGGRRKMETADKILEWCKFHLCRWFGRGGSDQKQSGSAAAEADPHASAPAPAEEIKLQVQHQANNLQEETVVEVTDRGGPNVPRRKGRKGDGRGDWH